MATPLQISTGLVGHDLLLQLSYWLMDTEGNFGRGPTPQAALESYLRVVDPSLLAAFRARSLTFTVYFTAREVPFSPAEGLEAFAPSPDDETE